MTEVPEPTRRAEPIWLQSYPDVWIPPGVGERRILALHKKQQWGLGASRRIARRAISEMLSVVSPPITHDAGRCALVVAESLPRPAER